MDSITDTTTSSWQVTATRYWFLVACVHSFDNHIIIIIIKNECHSNIIVNRLQGCGHSKKLQGK